MCDLSPEEYSRFKVQVEANRERYLQRRFSPDELVAMKLRSMRNLIRLNPAYEPTAEEFRKPPGAVEPPKNADELIKHLVPRKMKPAPVPFATNLELCLIEDCLEELRSLRKQNRKLFLSEEVSLYPIPFFGNPFQAEVLTLALNPSRGEFAFERSWTANLTAESLREPLLGYFRLATPPPHPWFDQKNEVLLQLGCSYQTNAAHVDLSPYPTLWPRELPTNNKHALAQIISSGTEHLRTVLRLCRFVKLVIVVDYRFQIGDRKTFSVFDTLRAKVPEIARHIVGKGDVPPIVRADPSIELQEWAFKNRCELKAHMQHSRFLCFE